MYNPIPKKLRLRGHTLPYGYSQGAYVVGDIFAGGGGTFGDYVQDSNQGLDVTSAAGKRVAAVIMWGLKRHTASQPYNKFSSAEKNGSYPCLNKELEALEKWKSVLIDYCVVTDPNCAGGNVNEDHWNYFELYSEEAAKWVTSQVEGNVTVTSLGTSGSSSVINISTQTTTLPSTAATAMSGTSPSSFGSAASTSYPVKSSGTGGGRIVSCLYLKRFL
ncbi:hypothetical protein BKA65DRAFT_566158 [Rhexocercosporidium sp. MPI-PUGE-AT-0058]|nr:hypothetical protein BKA65DRAFT_566158 [Rhexocercosporidium sp. MPI-PUGE-AT-0058]